MIIIMHTKNRDIGFGGVFPVGTGRDLSLINAHNRQ